MRRFQSSIFLFLAGGGLENNHGNMPLAVRTCSQHECHKPGAESAPPMAPSESCLLSFSPSLPFPCSIRHSAGSPQSRRMREMLGEGPETSGPAPWSRKQTSIQTCHSLPLCVV